MTTLDTNVSNYTLSELIAIAGLNELDHDEIISKTDEQIKRFNTSKPENNSSTSNSSSTSNKKEKKDKKIKDKKE